MVVVTVVLEVVGVLVMVKSDQSPPPTHKTILGSWLFKVTSESLQRIYVYL
jgi:hypothetical protein